MGPLTIDHFLPSQCSMSAVPTNDDVAAAPTAQTLRGDTATTESRFDEAPGTLGLGIICHVFPFQGSTSVPSTLPFWLANAVIPVGSGKAYVVQLEPSQ